MIDTHVHLNGKDLGRDLAGVVGRAVEAGVGEFVVVGYDRASSVRAMELAEGDSRIWAVVGIHPHEASAWDAEAERLLREWATHPRVVAVGEIGLDFYRDLSPRPAQYAAFAAQLAIAEEAGLPVVIHCRDAYDELMAVVADRPPTVPLILHCFAGTPVHARAAWERGWFLGVGGTVTYKKNDDLRAIVGEAPAESLLLETDAPYLSPEPSRGKFPNEPARVALVAERVAEIRGMSVDGVAEMTTANARRVFARMQVSVAT